MPQLDLFSFCSVTFYGSLILIIFFFIVHTFVLPPIGTALKLRAKFLTTKPIDSIQKRYTQPTFINPTFIVHARLLEARRTIAIKI